MSLGLVVQHLGPVSGSLLKLRGFVKDELAALLDRLARLEYRAAVNALLDARKSNNPEREINSAITCLRLSYEKFHENATNRSFFSRLAAGLKSTLTIGLATPANVSSAEGAVECCLLLAACYKAVGDLELASGFLAKAKAAFEVFAAARCKAAGDGAGLSPSYAVRMSMVEGEEKKMVEERRRVHALCEEIAAST